MDWMSDRRTARLQELIHRRDKVLAVLHPPSAAHARIMEKAGCEALSVGTGGVVGAYTDIRTRALRDCLSYYNGDGAAEPGSLAYYGGPQKWHELRLAAQETLESYVFDTVPPGGAGKPVRGPHVALAEAMD